MGGKLLGEDSLERKLLEYEKRIRALEAREVRRVLLDDTGIGVADSTTSTSYVPLGPTVRGVPPGANGKVLVGLTVDPDIAFSGELFVGFQVDTGPTFMGPDDAHAFRVDTTSGITQSATVWYDTVVLNPGSYNVTLMIRSGFGGTVGVLGRMLTCIPF